VKLVAQQSTALAALVQGDMTEAKERCVFIEDVETATFTRFAEFAYTGNYSVPEPDIILTSSDVCLEAQDENGADKRLSDVPADLGISSLPVTADDDRFDWCSSAIQSIKKKDKKKKGLQMDCWDLETSPIAEETRPISVTAYPAHRVGHDKAPVTTGNTLWCARRKIYRHCSLSVGA